MPNLANPDIKRVQRSLVWEKEHVVAVPPSGTIESGDLVYINSSAQAVAFSGTAGSAVDTSTNKVFGVAVGRSAVITADPDLYSKILVAPIQYDDYVVIRKMTATGGEATTSPADIGQPITLRYGAASTPLQGVVGANIKTGADAVHGVVVDIYSPTHLIVKFNQTALG
jgi:predicted RecA/RadA family phage recombinase